MNKLISAKRRELKLVKELKKEIDVLTDLKKQIVFSVVTGKLDVRGISIPDYEYVDDEDGEEEEQED